MADNNQKHVTATKYGVVLELKFAFNSATKDGYDVESAYEVNLAIRNNQLSGLDEAKVEEIETFLEQGFAKTMQTLTQIFTGNMTAEELKTYNKEGTLNETAEKKLIKDAEGIGQKAMNDISQFDKKYGSLFRDGEIEVTFKPRLKGPAL